MMLVLGGVTRDRLYGPSPYHRLQADAFLNGHLYLGESLDALEQNLAWHDGKVQQVWGLGFGLWLAPFEFVYRLFGHNAFPDRIAMGVAFALVAGYAGATGLRLIRACRSPAIGLGFVALTLFNPALFELNAGRHLIYEDAVLYACLVSLAILTAVIRVAAFGSTTDFFICSFLAGLVGLVRPTHLIYGLMGVSACALILYFRRQDVKKGLVGAGIFVGGLLFLAGTNQVRFGSPLEFGHRLTATGGGMVYFTRFDNPFRPAPVSQACAELFSATFLPTDHLQMNSAEDVSSGQMFRASSLPDVVRFQAPLARWRDMYMPTFDWSAAVLVMLGVGGATGWCVLQLRSCGGLRRFWRRPRTALTGVLLAWSGAAVLGLWMFYLYYPVLCARYLLDFAPAFTAAIALVWLGLSPRFPITSLLLLAVWLAWEILPARGGAPAGYLLTQRELPAATRSLDPNPLEPFRGRYSIDAHPASTHIAFNGEGWSPDDGSAAAVIVLAVDRPEFVELKVGPRFSIEGAKPESDSYRARIGGTELRLESVATDVEGVQVRFAVPDEIRQRPGDELLFLCFISNGSEESRSSQRPLYAVRWR